MKKLKNTTTNNIILLGSLAGAGALSGVLLSAKDKSMRNTFIFMGIFVGLIITRPISNLVLEPKNKV